jgi:hypothetical protein
MLKRNTCLCLLGLFVVLYVTGSQTTTIRHEVAPVTYSDE